jgi:hypothetical protein
MRTVLATFVCFVLLANVAFSTDGHMLRLVLPHPLRPGETVWLELTLGAIERGAEIEVLTAEGQFLGVISPFGIRSNQEAGTYTIPLPSDVFQNSRVSLRLSIGHGGHVPRMPSETEVKSVRLKITPIMQ